MNKKFLNAILFGALMVGSTSTFVSCKDYDDDIDGLQEQIDANKKQIDDILAAINGKKFIESYAPVEGGYVLTFTGGETLTIKNGANGAQGEKGEQGLQGLQGPKGETGATIVPKFKVDAENYWMVSVDEGATYEYVLNDAGEKIKAAGSEVNVEEAIGNYVKVDEEGYICIGEYRTSFKYNANIPSMIYNEKDGTMQVTIDGQSYTLLMEGSAFNGLQSIAFRKPYADNSTVYENNVKLDIYDSFWDEASQQWVYRKVTKEDWGGEEDPYLGWVVTGLGEKADVNAYQLYVYNKTSKERELFAAVPGKATFKVWPAQYSETDAEYFFSDSYQTRAEVPTWGAQKAVLKDGILTVNVVAEKDIEDGRMYMTSLDVKMYKQYTSSSDYFSIRSIYVNENRLMARHSQRDEYGWPLELQHNAHFVYDETYNLNDSIDAYLNVENVPELSEIGIEYTQKFELLPKDTEFNLNGKIIKSQQGIFQINDGVLSVKEQYQASAINEYAAVKVTTTVKSQEEGVADYVFENTVAIQAVREAAEPYAYDSIELVPNEGNLSLSYNADKATVIALNVRKFESEIGGRDIVAGNNDTKRNHLLPLYTYNAKTKSYEQLSKTNGIACMDAVDSDKLNVKSGDVLLYYRNGGDNADKDSLFLVVGSKVELAETTLYVSPRVQSGSPNSYKHVWNGTYKDGAPYAVCNSYDKKYFMLTLNKVSVTRNFSVSIKDAYKARTIIGDWSDAANGNFGIKSENFAHMYNIAPTDALAVFELNKDKQNAFVQNLMKNNQLVVEQANGEWRIAFTAPIDIKKVGKLVVDIFDADGYDVTDKNRVPAVTEEWTVARPLADFTGGAALKAINDPNLAEGTAFTLQQLIENSVAGTKTKAADFWKTLVLKDYAGETVVKFDGAAFKAVEVTERAALYKKTSAATGLRYIMANGTAKDEYFEVDLTTGKLTCIALPTGTEFTHTVNVVLQFVHDWGISEYAYSVTITRKQAN